MRPNPQTARPLGLHPANSSSETPADNAETGAPEALLDSKGHAIRTRLWYKIALGDGSELGYTTISVPNNANCGPRPPGQGAVFRFVADFPSELDDLVWTSGTRGFLRGFAASSDGDPLKGFLTVSTGAPMTVQFDEQKWYGCTGYRATGNRVLLFVLAKNQIEVSMRVQKDPNPGTGAGNVIKVALSKPFTVPLDVQFVRCGPVDIYAQGWQF